MARKVMITGKGRCNVTNRCTIDEFIEHVPENGRFLYSALHQFTPQDTMDFFEQLGGSAEDGTGQPRISGFRQGGGYCRRAGTLCARGRRRFHQGRAVALCLEDGVCTGVRLEDGSVLPAYAVAVCTGGLSYPLTGSTGDGYRLAEQAGHTIVPPRPSLVPLESDDGWCGDMQGLALKNVGIRVTDNESGDRIFADLGEMLFTHFGVSGPLVLSASAHMRHMAPGRYTLWIDWKPGLTLEQLDNRVLRDWQAYKNADAANALGKLLPRTAIPVVLRLAAIAGDTKCHSITREERSRLVSLLKAFPVSIRGFRPVEEAIITAGGVSVKEVQAKTMESKRVSGLYFAGEVLDVDAYTGGFNLQIAFSTGMALGQHI